MRDQVQPKSNLLNRYRSNKHDPHFVGCHTEHS